MFDYLFVFAVIFAGFSFGRFLLLFSFMRSHKDSIVRNTVYAALRVFIPIAMSLSIWQLPIDSWLMLVLPAFTVVVLLTGFALGLLLAHLYQLKPLQKGAYAPAGGFTNIGILGLFCVLVYVGESGVALIPLIKMFEEVVYFSIFFPYAARCVEQNAAKQQRRTIDPIIIITITACCLGLSLNAIGIERPESFHYITQVLVPVSSFLLMMTIGLSFQLQNFKKSWKPAFTLSLAKILCLPLVVSGLFYISGLWSADNILLIQTLFVIAAMPCAFIAIVPASIYKLDIDLASTTWGISMLLFIPTLPLLPWLLEMLSHSVSAPLVN